MLHWIIMIAGLIISFILLVKGADFFVDGCVSIARLLRVPDLIIGLTIVAMGTSAPEAAVSISSAVSNSENAGITVGNLFKSFKYIDYSWSQRCYSSDICTVVTAEKGFSAFVGFSNYSPLAVYYRWYEGYTFQWICT